MYSLLIEKDICDCENASIKLLCDYLCLSSGDLLFFSVRVSSFYSYFLVTFTYVGEIKCSIEKLFSIYYSQMVITSWFTFLYHYYQFKNWRTYLKVTVLTDFKRKKVSPGPGFKSSSPALSCLVQQFIWVAQFERASVRRTWDMSLNPGPDYNFSLKIRNYAPQKGGLNTKFSLLTNCSFIIFIYQ